ncbi:MAG: hypothetical protein AAF497_12555 [Planctomycetota bacterium]
MLLFSGVGSNTDSFASDPWLIQRTLKRIDNQVCPVEDLKLVHRYWMNCIHTGDPPIGLVALKRDFFRGKPREQYEKEKPAWDSFVRSLAQSDHENARISVQLHLLSEQTKELSRVREIDPDRLEYMKAAGRVMANQLEGRPRASLHDFGSETVREFNWLLYRLENQESPRARRRKLPVQATKPRTRPSNPSTPEALAKAKKVVDPVQRKQTTADGFRPNVNRKDCTRRTSCFAASQTTHTTMDKREGNDRNSSANPRALQRQRFELRRTFRCIQTVAKSMVDARTRTA